MANHKSALKRMRQNTIRQARNAHIRTNMRTHVKKIREAVAAGDIEAARAALDKTIPIIDKASTKGVIHKNTASRKISRLTRLVATIA